MHARSAEKSVLFLGRRGPARKSLLDFAVPYALGEASAAVARHHIAPECHGAWVAHIFDDFPFPGEAVENQCCSIAADAGAAVLHADEKLRHSVISRFLARLWDAGPRDQRESHRIRALENQQRMRLVVGKPVRKNLGLVRIVGAENREQTGIEISQGLDVFAVDALDPLAILFRMSDVANADKQRNTILLKRHSPDEHALWQPARASAIS